MCYHDNVYQHVINLFYLARTRPNIMINKCTQMMQANVLVMSTVRLGRKYSSTRIVTRTIILSKVVLFIDYKDVSLIDCMTFILSAKQ